MPLLESNPHLARYYMAQIISDHLQELADTKRDQAKVDYVRNIRRLYDLRSNNETVMSEVNSFVSIQTKSAILSQYLDRTLRKITPDPNKNTRTVLTFDSLVPPQFDTFPLEFKDLRVFNPPFQEGSNEALADLLNAISTDQPPLLKFTREQIFRYFLSPDSTPQLIKSIPFPTRLPHLFITFIFPSSTNMPFIVFDSQPIPPTPPIK